MSKFFIILLVFVCIRTCIVISSDVLRLPKSPEGDNLSVIVNETGSMASSNTTSLTENMSSVDGSMFQRTCGRKQAFRSRHTLYRYNHRWNTENKTKSTLLLSNLYSDNRKRKVVCQSLTDWAFSPNLPNPLLSHDESRMCPVRSNAVSIYYLYLTKTTDDAELGEEILLTDQSVKNHTESGNCTIVIFYARWCNMSANAAPHFNAIPRAFDNIRFVAVDIYSNSEVISIFGIYAVPTVLLFHNDRVQARFTNGSINIYSLADFIEKFTDQKASFLKVQPSDFYGPIPTVAIPKFTGEELIFAWLFILISCIYLLYTQPAMAVFLRLFLFVQSLLDDEEFADSKFKVE